MTLSPLHPRQWQRCESPPWLSFSINFFIFLFSLLFLSFLLHINNACCPYVRASKWYRNSDSSFNFAVKLAKKAFTPDDANGVNAFEKTSIKKEEYEKKPPGLLPWTWYRGDGVIKQKESKWENIWRGKQTGGWWLSQPHLRNVSSWQIFCFCSITQGKLSYCLKECFHF